MKHRRIHVGLRTVKTAVAVIIAMILVEPYGATSSRLILAMLGAMAAVQPTFKESLDACITQTVSVIGGVAAQRILSFSALLYSGHGLYRCGDGSRRLCHRPDLGYGDRSWHWHGHQYGGVPIRQQPTDPGYHGRTG